MITENLSFSLLFTISIVILSTFINQIDGQTSNNNNNIPGRVYPGCALTGDKLYCFGGFTGNPIDNNGITYTSAFNDNLELDLTVFDNFTSFNASKIQWNKKSNSINGVPIVAAGDITTTPLSDGTFAMYGGRTNQLIDFPFARYNPQSDTWSSVSLPNDTYYLRSRIVNLGNDSIWIFGGDVRTLTQTPQLILSVYDFKSGTWPVSLPLYGDSPLDHTATIVNGMIYIVGGGFLQASNNGTYRVTPFNYIQTFNTMDSSWDNFTATGDQPSNRCFHSTVATSDNKYLLIYGGMLPYGTLFQKSNDVYYVLDIKNKSFKYVNVDNSPQSNTVARFGHFAAIYNTNYLLLAFGYNDLTSAANSLNVLNIQNPYQPNWVAYPTTTTTNNTSNSTVTNSPPSDGVNLKTIVPAVVVPVTVALLGIAVGLFLFLRQRKKRQQKAFVLEQEDPRRTLDNQDYGNLISEEGTTTVRESNSFRSVKNDHEVNNPLIMNDYQNNNNNNNNNVYSDHHDNNTIIYGKADLPNDYLPNTGLVKPFEPNIGLVKPFEPNTTTTKQFES